jgi:hypothetical protein
MALDINTIKQASPKANQVATEQYVDTSIAGIDVSGDISANNDAFAQAQGFTNYADMVNKYTSLGKTIINGGYINTGLVNANSITANSISADKIMANSISADKLSVTQLSAIVADLGTVNAGVLFNTGGNASSYTMKIDLNNGEIHIK